MMKKDMFPKTYNKQILSSRRLETASLKRKWPLICDPKELEELTKLQEMARKFHVSFNGNALSPNVKDSVP